MSDVPSRYGRVLWQNREAYVELPQRGSPRLLESPPWAGGRAARELPADVFSSGQARILCPVTPSKIIGIGRNYKKHAEELKNEVPEEPLMFFKPPSSLLEPGGVVVLPPESERVDYEGELAVVIGARCRRVSAADAARAIFGYTVACDVTARDLQQKDKQWTRAKGFDTFCPIGPFVQSLGQPGGRALQLHVNGERRQDGNTRDMLFDVPTLIAYASNAMTLEPGDVILTGTPEGVGPLHHGDRVKVSVDGLADLEFSVSRGA